MNYQIIKKINSGTFGIVYKVIYKEKIYALKKVTNIKVNNEVYILNNLKNNPYISEIVDVDRDEEYTYILLNYYKNGDLNNLSLTDKIFSDKDVSKIAKQMLNALAFCNLNNIAMCDVKPSNILIDDEFNYKLCDFGSSQFSKNPYEGLVKIKGTPVFIAPEILNRNYGYACDIYSLGITLYYLLTKEYPFNNDILLNSNRILLAIYNNDLIYNKDLLSKTSYDFIKNLVLYDKYKRFTIEEALDHPFITK
jgi:calcium-dependent protein kinase